MQHYTEGNVPEALIGVPETWTVDQIKAFQTYWDSILEGSTAERVVRHAPCPVLVVREKERDFVPVKKGGRRTPK